VQDHVYRIIEIAGSSEKSIEDAIHTAIARASSTLKHLRWFELVQTRGHIEGGKVGKGPLRATRLRPGSIHRCWWLRSVIAAGQISVSSQILSVTLHSTG
jgi:dodecin